MHYECCVEIFSDQALSTKLRVPVPVVQLHLQVRNDLLRLSQGSMCALLLQWQSSICKKGG